MTTTSLLFVCHWVDLNKITHKQNISTK